MYDLIVVGAGPGGYQVAAHAGQMGKAVALVEKDELGGTCLNVGCIPAKAFLWSSRIYRQCTEARLFGVEVGAARLDLRAVVGRKDRIVAAQKRGVEGLLRRSGVEVLAGDARVIARNRVSVGGEVLEAANVLVATGSRPLLPPIPGIGTEHVLTSSHRATASLRWCGSQKGHGAHGGGRALHDREREALSASRAAEVVFPHPTVAEAFHEALLQVS